MGIKFRRSTGSGTGGNGDRPGGNGRDGNGGKGNGPGKGGSDNKKNGQKDGEQTVEELTAEQVAQIRALIRVLLPAAMERLQGKDKPAKLLSEGFEVQVRTDAADDEWDEAVLGEGTRRRSSVMSTSSPLHAELMQHKRMGQLEMNPREALVEIIRTELQAQLAVNNVMNIEETLLAETVNEMTDSFMGAHPEFFSQSMKLMGAANDVVTAFVEQGLADVAGVNIDPCQVGGQSTHATQQLSAYLGYTSEVDSDDEENSNELRRSGDAPNPLEGSGSHSDDDQDNDGWLSWGMKQLGLK